MAEVLRLRDGSNHIVMDRKDLLEVIDYAAGDEVRSTVEKELNDIEEEYLFEADTIDEIRTEAEKEAYQKKLELIRKATEGLADIIQAKTIDRKKLSEICGGIRNIPSTAPF